MKHQTSRAIAVVLTSLLVGANFAWPVAAKTRLVPRRLDGVLVAPNKANLRLVAVMVDNHAAARPQASLNKASVVYEALAEGGIPRFMAVYARYDLPLVGPVRSARPYFVRYAAEYPAAMAHVGGSPDAQNLIKKLKIRNIEGQKGTTARFFFRYGLGVHSTFTNGSYLTNAMRNKKGAKAILNYEPWQFQNDPALKERPTKRQRVAVDLGAGRNYRIEYEYSRRRNAYLRSTGGRAHFDRVTKSRLTAKNVILLFVPKERVLDRQGRIELKTVGRGKAVLLQNGKAQTITWRKASDTARTTFAYGNGSAVKLVRGSTWITVVPKGKSYRIY